MTARTLHRVRPRGSNGTHKYRIVAPAATAYGEVCLQKACSIIKIFAIEGFQNLRQGHLAKRRRGYKALIGFDHDYHDVEQPAQTATVRLVNRR